MRIHSLIKLHAKAFVILIFVSCTTNSLPTSQIDQQLPNIVIFSLSGLNADFFNLEFDELIAKNEISSNGFIRFENFIAKENNFLFAYMSQEKQESFLRYKTLDLANSDHQKSLEQVYTYLYGKTFGKPEIYFLKVKDKVQGDEIRREISAAAKGSNPIFLHFFFRSELHTPYAESCSNFASDFFLNFEKDVLLHPERLYLAEYLYPRNETYHNLMNHLATKYPKLNISSKVFRKNYTSNFYNKELLEKWRLSPSFKDDLTAIKNQYRCQLKKSITPILKYIDEASQKSSQLKNTVFVLTGDHGESFGENGVFSHSISVNEASIKVPVLIYLPNQVGITTIESQTSYSSLAQFIRKLAAGTFANNQKIVTYLQNEMYEEKILSNNCAKTLFSLRWKNKFKLVFDTLHDEFSLFDLGLDPTETIDVSKKYEKIFSELKIDFYKRISDRLEDNAPAHCGFSVKLAN